MKRIVICLTLLVTVAMVAEAATTVDTNVVRVALFKNGLAFFIRQAELPARPGEVEIGPVPVASHGSLWVGWGAGVEFANLSARQVEVAEGREALTIPELLRANVGKRVKLEFASESLTPLQGVVKAFPQRPTAPQPNPYMADITGPSSRPHGGSWPSAPRQLAGSSSWTRPQQRCPTSASALPSQASWSRRCPGRPSPSATSPRA